MQKVPEGQGENMGWGNGEGEGDRKREVRELHFQLIFFKEKKQEESGKSGYYQEHCLEHSWEESNIMGSIASLFSSNFPVLEGLKKSPL